MPALATGTTAPKIELTTTDGKPFSLQEALKRGPVIAAFFKISCPVCQFTFPFVERLHQAFKGKNATIVGISQNDKKDTQAFMKEYGVTFPVVLDDRDRYPVSNAYGLTNVPTLFYIAPDGEIEISSVGWSRADLEEISKRLSEATGAPKPNLFKPGEDVPDFKAG